jgi:lysyl endopeptidase
MKRLLAALLIACALPLAHAQYGGDPGEQDRIYTGLWWNPAESGWGLNTTHQGNILFATLFTYAADGQPMWLVASRLVGTPEFSYSGPLYRTTGPPFFQAPWTPVTPTQVGTMNIAYNSPDEAQLTYTVDGVTVRKRVERQVFGTAIPLCVAVSGSRAAATNYQDLWWNPAESGWGINLTHQGDILFATLFTYLPSGRDGWFVGPGLLRQADGSFTGPLYATTGPAFDASPWPGIAFSQVGTMTLRFANGERGTLAYDVQGTAVVKSIERQVFGAVTSACR